MRFKHIVQTFVYPFGRPLRAPPGCLQYQTGLNGQVKTFNFDALNGNHLPNQRCALWQRPCSYKMNLRLTDEPF